MDFKKKTDRDGVVIENPPYKKKGPGPHTECRAFGKL
jgi:hypothetical protein